MFGSDKNNTKEIGLIWQRFVPVERDVAKINSELEKVNNSVSSLKEKVQQPTESQKIAQTAARSATSFRTNVKKIKEEIEAIFEDVRTKHESIIELNESTQKGVEGIKESNAISAEAIDYIESAKLESKSLRLELERNIADINSLISENDDIYSKVDSAKSSYDEILEIHSKAQGIVKNITSYHTKVRELRDEILGYDSEDEHGEIEHIDGIRDELESTYNRLKGEFAEFEEEFNKHKCSTQEEFNAIISDSKDKIDSLIDGYDSKYEEVFAKIEKLLPAALTAGLSSAYDDKIKTEKDELIGFNSTFTNAIRSLVLVSLIPFFVDIYLLAVIGKDLVSVISDTPKLLLSILPLYLPIFWIAYSANKKANLSKRLIEEYTHKGVLSKTFEGLSTQIEELQDDEMSHELRVKLLFNILHVNAENPGKLISDYKTTDHPVMDALDKSVKLANAVEKLKGIPGFTKLVDKLDKESKEIIVKTEQKVTKALNSENNSNSAKQNPTDKVPEESVV